MVADWMRVGFVHGVMNTDNMSILGLTIDYGPYGWVDDFDPDWTPNTTDAGGRRYRFGAAGADRLLEPGAARRGAGAGVRARSSRCRPACSATSQTLSRVTTEQHRRQAGIRASADDDDLTLMRELQELLHRAEVDMTIFFRRARRRRHRMRRRSIRLAEAFYDDRKRQDSGARVQGLARSLRGARAARIGSAHERRERMDAANPRYVLRNYLAQQAIDRAEQGDYAGIDELLEVLRRPYDDQPGADAFDQKRPDWARHRAGCSMLSCSS